jgi:hypothetical protein
MEGGTSMKHALLSSELLARGGDGGLIIEPESGGETPSPQRPSPSGSLASSPGSEVDESSDPGNETSEEPSDESGSDREEGNSYEQGTDGEEEGGEEPPPPPPPPQLIVDRSPDPPVLLGVDSGSLSLQWTPVSATVQSKEMAVVEYVLTYELQMQQVRAAPRAPAQRCFERPCASAQGPPGPS